MTKIEEYVLELLKCALNKDCIPSKALSELSKEEMEGVLEEAKIQTVEGFVLSKALELNPRFKEEYENELMAEVTRNIYVITEHVRIGTALEKAGIEYVMIKGCASGEYYNNPTYRGMGDVDVLVSQKDTSKAEEVLLKLGYIATGKLTEYHNTYYFNGKSCELHDKISDLTEGNFEFADLTNDIIKSKRKIKTVIGEIFVPSPYYHGIIMLFHFYRHLFEGIGLRHLCDWAVFIQSEYGKNVSDELFEIAKENKLRKLFEAMNGASSFGFGFEKIKYNDSSISKELLEDIFSSGNFGRKGRRNNAWLGFYINHSFEKQSMFNRLIDVMKKKVYRLHPNIGGSRVIFAFWFALVPFYYLFTLISGKTKISDIKSNKSFAKDRNEFLANFFE